MKNYKWMFDRISQSEYVTYHGEDWRDKKEKFYRDACAALDIFPGFDSSRTVFELAYNERHSDGWTAIYMEMDGLYDMIISIHRMMDSEGV